MTKSVTTKARETISDFAKRSARGATSVAAEALDAAATAVTEVVLKSAAKGMQRGGAGIRHAIPRAKKATGSAARGVVKKPKRKAARSRAGKSAKSKARRRAR